MTAIRRDRHGRCGAFAGTGALASAGAALLGPIGVIAGFLGPLGKAVVELARE